MKSSCLVQPVFEETSEDVIGYACQWHRPIQAFAEKILQEFQETIPLDKIRHGYFRKVKLHHCQATIMDCRKDETGAFPVTYVLIG